MRLLKNFLHKLFSLVMDCNPEIELLKAELIKRNTVIYDLHNAFEDVILLQYKERMKVTQDARTLFLAVALQHGGEYVLNNEFINFAQDGTFYLDIEPTDQDKTGIPTKFRYLAVPIPEEESQDASPEQKVEVDTKEGE